MLDGEFLVNFKCINDVCVDFNPFCSIPTHFLMIIDANVTDSNILGQARGSIHSIRRGSTDVRSIGSDYYRRTSLAKLNSLPLEAPITKVRTT